MRKRKVIRGAIVLVPVGPVLPELLTWLADRMAERLRREVTIGEGIPLPEEGYDPRRRQYRGKAILDLLRALPAPAAGRLLGLTEADCYGSRPIPGRAYAHSPGRTGTTCPGRSWQSLRHTACLAHDRGDTAEREFT